MPKLAIMSLCFCILAAPAWAGDEYSMHDKELLFRVNGLDSIGLSSFDGGLGLRYFLGSHIALRPGFNFSDRTTINEPRDGQVEGDQSDQTSYRVEMVVEYHLEPRGRMNSYWGLGFEYSNSDDTFRNARFDTLTPGQSLESTRNETAYSVLGLLGVQWVATESIRLGAEYQLNYSIRDRETVRTAYQTEDLKQNDDATYFSANSSSIYAAIRF